MEEKTGGLIFLFVFIVLGAIFAGIVADNVYGNIHSIQAGNETLDISSARVAGGGQNISQNPYKGLNVSKRTQGFELTSVSVILLENYTALVENTDYIANVTGDQYIYFINSTTMRNSTNTTYATYSFESEAYVDDSNSRILIGLITVFFVIGIIVFVIFYVKRNYIDQISM